MNGNVIFTPHLYTNYTQPHGYLTRDVACHALFYYSTVATNVWDRAEHALVMEGDTSPPEPNYHQLFLSISKMYGVDPNRMENFWELIDKQCEKLRITKAPDAVRHGSRDRIIILPHQERLH